MKECQFFVIRYFADPIRDEPINIGIILLSIGDDSEHDAKVRFTKNWRRVLCIDPRADVEMMSAWEEDIQKYLRSPVHGARRTPLESLEDDLSNMLRIDRFSSPAATKLVGSKPTLTNDFDGELERLMELYVEDRHPAASADCSDVEDVED
jgi:hypothetical protein